MGRASHFALTVLHNEYKEKTYEQNSNCNCIPWANYGLYCGHNFPGNLSLDDVLYEKILKEEFKKTMEWHEYDESKVIFQHDNDPKHTAKTVKKYLEEQPFSTMVWPAQSPLTSIQLKTSGPWSNFDFLGIMTHLLKAFMNLWDRAQDVWNDLTIEDCRKVMDSMPKRCRDVIKAKGYWIDH
ncbi:hypothetical protein BCR42DRAFT_338477 [Absidia repens]|uniref:Tc1-like transposase DDE domain-containing protein n=1 Tax=Absidia repens TaxID=90262 RepID=A0A1X2HXN6_9FUNG|nr:hypothetical protein BCR42DRAFT_338477 [Absidia repens]